MRHVVSYVRIVIVTVVSQFKRFETRLAVDFGKYRLFPFPSLSAITINRLIQPHQSGRRSRSMPISLDLNSL